MEVLEELLAPDLSIPTLGPSFEPTVAGLRQFNEAARAGIPDLRAAIEEIFASGDWVAAKVTWSGTQTGEFLGLPASGNAFSVSEFEIVRVEDGRIVDLRSVIDVGDLMAQLVSKNP